MDVYGPWICTGAGGLLINKEVYMCMWGEKSNGNIYGGGGKGGRERGKHVCFGGKELERVCHKDGQSRIYATYMTVYFEIPLPKMSCMHRIYMVLADPINMGEGGRGEGRGGSTCDLGGRS